MLANRTLAKRHLCLVKIAYELKRIGIRSPRHQTISPPRIELSVSFKKSHYVYKTDKKNLHEHEFSLSHYFIIFLKT